MHTLQVTLNASGVAAPAQSSAWQCSEIIAFCLQSAANADLSNQPEIASATMAYKFSSPQMTANERYSMYEAWLLSKGFHELARGVHHSLEEAILYLELLRFQPGSTTLGKFEAQISAVKRRAGRLSFPDLLNEVNANLTAPLTFDDDFRSFQKVRNCLEHRAGVVSLEDVNEDRVLPLSMPRLKMFYIDNHGREIELQVGAVIDRHLHTDMAEILIKRETRTKSYVLGERIRFDSAQFNEVAFACHLFASDLASKLPTAVRA